MVAHGGGWGAPAPGTYAGPRAPAYTPRRGAHSRTRRFRRGRRAAQRTVGRGATHRTAGRGATHLYAAPCQVRRPARTGLPTRTGVGRHGPPAGSAEARRPPGAAGKRRGALLRGHGVAERGRLLAAKAVAEPEERVVRVEGHVLSARLHRRHRSRKVERQ
jgi:hypothetical protein